MVGLDNYMIYNNNHKSLMMIKVTLEPMGER